MFFNSVIGGCGEKVYIPPPQAFPWWERPVLRILSRQMVCRLHQYGRVLSGRDSRLRYLSIDPYPRLENGDYLANRIDKVSKEPWSPLAKRLDAIIWEYLQLTAEASRTMEELESMNCRQQSDVIQEKIDLLRADLKNLGAEYLGRIMGAINLHDRPLLPARDFDQAVGEELQQGEIRQLVAKAQMCHDDLTVCRPAKVATQN